MTLYFYHAIAIDNENQDCLFSICRGNETVSIFPSFWTNFLFKRLLDILNHQLLPHPPTADDEKLTWE
jgi:hypothetical protein